MHLYSKVQLHLSQRILGTRKKINTMPFPLSPFLFFSFQFFLLLYLSCFAYSPKSSFGDFFSGQCTWDHWRCAEIHNARNRGPWLQEAVTGHDTQHVWLTSVIFFLSVSVWRCGSVEKQNGNVKIQDENVLMQKGNGKIQDENVEMQKGNGNVKWKCGDTKEKCGYPKWKFGNVEMPNENGIS